MAEMFLEPSVTWDALGGIAILGWEPVLGRQGWVARCAHPPRGHSCRQPVREEQRPWKRVCS